jgi:hypothetical protein
MELGTNLGADIEAVVNYLWENEERHYYESDCPENHIFLILKKLKKYLQNCG